ncbi:MAG: ABC transporter permease [Nitrospiraceae bacterium]|nr:ABC transporter permease [Nitrospiraceae bacterium]
MHTLVTFAFKNVRRKPARTAILIFAIALLVSALVFSISFVQRVNGSIKRTSERLGADLIVVPNNARGAAEEVLLENQTKSFYMDRSILDRVRAIDGVAVVTEQIYLVTLSTMCCSVPEAMVVAFNPETDFIIKPWLAEKLKRPLAKGEAVAGAESSFNIRLGLVDVNSKLFGNEFKLVGSLDKTGTGLDNAVFITLDNMDQIIKSGAAGKLKPSDISIIFVRVKPGVDPSRIAAKVEDTIIEADAVSRRDIGRNVITALKDISRIFTMTIILAAVMSFFLVWAIFTAIANERAKEVGIMRAIGAKESHIMRLYLIEVLTVGVIGSLLGILAGSALSAVFSSTFSIVQQLSTSLTLTERVVIALVSFLGGTLICVLGALGPVRRLKGLEPLLVIKTE